ncbi:MAG TPA: response regulator [Thermomicrobiales bacterium]
MPVESSSPLVLAIEDDAAIRGVYAELLTEEGFRVVTWGAVADDAHAELANLEPDLVVLDLVIAQQPAGWDLLVALHGGAETAAIPVLVVTAAGLLVRDRAAELEAWGCGVLMKPFDVDELVDAVRACLAPGRNRAAS